MSAPTVDRSGRGSPARVGATPSDRVTEEAARGREAELHDVDGYRRLRARTEADRHKLLRFLLECRTQGKRVAGLRESNRPGQHSAQLLRNRSGPDGVHRRPNPYKHGRFTPGNRIPIDDPSQDENDQARCGVALPWNLKTELDEQSFPTSSSGSGNWSSRYPRCTYRRAAPESSPQKSGDSAMRVLLTGHQGYLGTVMAAGSAVGRARGHRPGLRVFAQCTLGSRHRTTHRVCGWTCATCRWSISSGFDAVVHLAALSNDPSARSRHRSPTTSTTTHRSGWPGWPKRRVCAGSCTHRRARSTAPRR